MATTQTLAILTQENKTFYDRVLLERMLPDLVYADYGQKRPAPKHEGDTVNFRKMNSLAVALTPLTEGVTPAGNALSMSSITATVSQYGDFVEMSDKIDLIAIDPVVTEAVVVLAEQAALTIDTINRDIICAGTNVQYAGGKASRILTAAADVLTGTEIKKAVRTLRRNNAKVVQDGSFVGIIGPDAEYDLMADPMWIDVAKYQNKEQLLKGELGKLYGVKFVRTSNNKIFTGLGAAGINIHATLIIAKDAYGLIDISGSGKPESIIKGVGSSGTADALNQRSTAGWKCLFTTKMINELALIRIEHSVSA